MSYTYPQALNALQDIAKDFMRILRPNNLNPVRVVSDVHSSTASVSWDHYGVTINLPVRPATSIMTQTEFEDWTAYLLHEMGHPTHTDLTTWKEACVTGLSRLTNAAEDVRMEKALIKSGLVPNAKAVLSRLVSRKVAEARIGKWKPNSRKEIGWTLCVLGRVANGYAIDATDVAWIKSQIKPGSTVDKILGWALPELAACSSTRECMELAKRISDAIAVPSQEPQQPTQGEQSEQSEQGEQGEQGEEGQGEEGQGEEGQGEEGQGDSNQKPAEGATDTPDAAPAQDSPEAETSPGEAPNASGKGGIGHGDGTTDDESPVANETELTERELAPEGTGLTGDEAFHARSVLEILRKGALDQKPNDDMVPQRKRPSFVPYMREAAAKASRQRALLARALRANENDDREGGRKSGRLDRGALSRAMAGSPNVFARRDISEGYDTDVVILLDASGSMSSNMHQALEMGLIIAQAAGSVGASCTTEIFNSRGYARAGKLADKRAPKVEDFAALVNSASGGTPLSFQMARAAIAQSKRAVGKRRVVFVVTDGGCDHGPAAVKGTATYLEQTYGTVLAHVSIGNPLAGCFKAEVLVPHGKSVADIGLEHFVKVLQAL
jgi:hypothetical protein